MELPFTLVNDYVITTSLIKTNYIVVSALEYLNNPIKPLQLYYNHFVLGLRKICL